VERGTYLKEEGLWVKLRNGDDIHFIHALVSHKHVYFVSYQCHDTGELEAAGFGRRIYDDLTATFEFGVRVYISADWHNQQ
jgi:hypothetical protein